MKVVVGLGNPGPKYQHTRHNVGFAVLSELARRNAAPAPRSRFESEVAEFQSGDDKVLLVAPQTLMNLSGRAVHLVVSFFQLPLENVLIVCDDLNLETGRLRLRPGGSAGGQKGLKNIIDQLGTETFARLRIGIGRPPGRVSSTDYVLSRFRGEEREAIDGAIVLAADGVEQWIGHGLSAAMNLINAPQEKNED